jgi:hypothetical protein
VNRSIKWLPAALAVTAAVAVTASATAADSKAGAGVDHAIRTHVIAGGAGRTSAGGAYVLRATIGQFAPEMSSNGGYAVSGGFWKTIPADAVLFADGFETTTTP